MLNMNAGLAVIHLVTQPPQYCLDLMRVGCARIKRPNFLKALDLDELDCDSQNMQEFISSWDSLVCDENMADGGTYRLRRFGVYSAKRAGGEVTEEAHQPHFQTKKFNTLNGGTLRHFSEIKQHIVNNQVMQAILNFGSLTFGAVAPMNDWHIEVHQFRIIAEAGGGKPTPEGIHQDGVDFALMVMIGRSNVTGGETSIYDLEGNKLSRFSLQEPLEVAIVNDRCVAHGVSPILPDNLEEEGYRDVLVVTFKRL